MSIHIGTSGWSYDHWQGIMYPHGTKRWNRLNYYIQEFNTVELNSSFYRFPATNTFKSWQRRLPQGFLLSVKAPRYLTHTKRLYQPEDWINRIKECWHHLGNKRAVLLVQLSPNFALDFKRLHYFLQCIPPWIKLAVEFRHPSWHIEPIFHLLEDYEAAYCVMSGAGLPCVLRSTAPFVYVRMHGPSPDHLYGGSYSQENLFWWESRIREWERQQKDIFIYFNNDGEGNAVRNASSLKTLIK